MERIVQDNLQGTTFISPTLVTRKSVEGG